MNNSIYSTANPIRLIDAITYRKQPTMATCGQACVAMLADVEVAEVCKVMDNDSSTTYENIAASLDYYGFRHRLRKDKPKNLPDICILRVQFPDYGHSVLYYKGTYYDPEFGVLDDCHPGGIIDEDAFIEVLR